MQSALYQSGCTTTNWWYFSVCVNLLDHMLCVYVYVCEKGCLFEWALMCVLVHIFGLSPFLCLISSHYLWFPFAPPLLPCPLLSCVAAYHPKAWARDLAPRQTGLHENRQCSRPRVSQNYSSVVVRCGDFLFGCLLSFSSFLFFALQFFHLPEYISAYWYSKLINV